MADHSSDPIECPEILTRVFRNRSHCDDLGNATEDAFILRENDLGKLSVFRQNLISVDESKASFRKTYGAASLHTGHVRTIKPYDTVSLDVIPSEGEGTTLRGHSSVINLPDPLKERKHAEYIGGLLRDQSRKA
jgi:hypothetical protein